MRYRGINKNGVGVTGQADISNVAEFVEDYYRRGFRQLTVYIVSGGTEQTLGRIEPHPDTGQRTWWAEDDGTIERLAGPAHDPERRAGEDPP